MKQVVIIFIAFMMLGALLASWTESNLEFWLTMIKGQPVDVPYALALILSIFTNIFGFTFNIISELFKLIL